MPEYGVLAVELTGATMEQKPTKELSTNKSHGDCPVNDSATCPPRSKGGWHNKTERLEGYNSEHPLSEPANEGALNKKAGSWCFPGLQTCPTWGGVNDIGPPGS